MINMKSNIYTSPNVCGMRLFAAGLLLAVVCSLPCIGAEVRERVVLGDERFEAYLPLLAGKRVAIFSNQTGIVGDRVRGSKLADVLEACGGSFPEIPVKGRCARQGQPAEACARQGRSAEANCSAHALEAAALIPFTEPAQPGGTIEYGPHLLDVLLEKGVKVSAVFSPEHGFRGDADAGERVGSSVDAKTGVPILSLYGQGSPVPGADKMDRFDVLVVDIQDVGLRFYTYYVSMFHLMEACARFNKPVIILDRPNPNGFYVDGPLLDMRFKSGVGWLPIPTVHGMTLGELALMINGEGWITDGSAEGKKLQCDLTVVPCLRYSHQNHYSLILPPSPNLKDMKAVYLYASTCYFEGTVVSVGRGTAFPFEVYGHPAMRGYSFQFTPQSLPGAKNPRYEGEVCKGVDLRERPLRQIWADGMTFEYVLDAWRNLQLGEAFFGTNKHFDRLAGVGWIREQILSGKSAEELKAQWAEDVARFKELRRPYLLYAE